MNQIIIFYGFIDLASTGSANGLRQAQPTGFDRLRQRASTGSDKGLRQAQTKGFDRLRQRASTGSAKGKTRSLSLSKGAGWLSN
jgi:hypothetical protein